jgi:hypothetical protein
MRASRWFMFLVALLAGPTAIAAPCPDPQTLARIAAMGSVFIGEMHGNNESPAFVRCVVEQAIKAGAHPTVALEQAPEARNLQGAVWSGTDGRNSVAMSGLVTWLLAQEKAGALSIAWLDDMTRPFDARDAAMGEALQALVAKGTVIAYAGNNHAQKSAHIVPGLVFKPAGEYPGAAMKHILVLASGPGTTWACIGKCAVQTLGAGPAKALPGKLTDASTMGDDALLGYDFVYAVPTFSASPPARSPHG